MNKNRVISFFHGGWLWTLGRQEKESKYHLTFVLK